jgi:hypothetical protein
MESGSIGEWHAYDAPPVLTLCTALTAGPLCSGRTKQSFTDWTATVSTTTHPKRSSRARYYLLFQSTSSNAFLSLITQIVLPRKDESMTYGYYGTEASKTYPNPLFVKVPRPSFPPSLSLSCPIVLHYGLAVIEYPLSLSLSRTVLQ